MVVMCLQKGEVRFCLNYKDKSFFKVIYKTTENTEKILY